MLTSKTYNLLEDLLARTLDSAQMAKALEDLRDNEETIVEP